MMICLIIMISLAIVFERGSYYYKSEYAFTGMIVKACGSMGCIQRVLADSAKAYRLSKDIFSQNNSRQ